MVSVIIPTHNRDYLVGRAIRSVQNQTYQDFEIIVVSDGSTDNTETVVKSIEITDSRVRFIGYKPAKGGNIARNTGISAARGEYIAFLDDDDTWMPKKLEFQMQVFESNPQIGLVYTGVHIVYVKEKIEYNSRARDEGDLSKRILLDNCIGTTSTVVCKREILDRSGIFDIDLKALQDYDLWIRCCQLCAVGVVSSEQIYYYNYTNNTGNDRQVSSLTEKYKEALDYINTKYENLLINLDSQERKTKRLNEIGLLINKSLRNGNKKEARMLAIEYIRLGRVLNGMVFFILSFCSYRVALKIRSII